MVLSGYLDTREGRPQRCDISFRYHICRHNVKVPDWKWDMHLSFAKFIGEDRFRSSNPICPTSRSLHQGTVVTVILETFSHTHSKPHSKCQLRFQFLPIAVPWSDIFISHFHGCFHCGKWYPKLYAGGCVVVCGNRWLQSLGQFSLFDCWKGL